MLVMKGFPLGIANYLKNLTINDLQFMCYIFSNLYVYSEKMVSLKRSTRHMVVRSVLQSYLKNAIENSSFDIFRAQLLSLLLKNGS